MPTISGETAPGFPEPRPGAGPASEAVPAIPVAAAAAETPVAAMAGSGLRRAEAPGDADDPPEPPPITSDGPLIEVTRGARS